MTRVAIQGLVKRYGALTAVAGVDLEVAEGEFVVLLGPSGCGKTTTLRCVAGLEEVSEGQIVMGTRVVSAPGLLIPPEKRAIGMVFQSYAIWPHMTVFENVAFGLKLKHLLRQEVAKRVGRTLELVGLSGYGERPASQLSGGEQQRVALARALILEPRVLLFDEPLSNLDAKLREHMRFELHHLQKRLGITAIYVTHDQQEAMVLADRIALMHAGRIVQVGAPHDVYNRPASLFAAEFIGRANVLHGEVCEAGAMTRVRLANGLVVTSADRGASVGQGVDALCRPEHLQIATPPLMGDNVFTARVNGTFFLGSVAEVHLEAGDIQLYGQLSPPVVWPPGQHVWVRIPPEHVVLLARPHAVAGALTPEVAPPALFSSPQWGEVG